MSNTFHINEASIPAVITDQVTSPSVLTASNFFISAATSSIAPTNFTLLQLNGAPNLPVRINIDTNNGTSSFGASMRFRRSHGDADHPGALLQGDTMMQLVGDGWNGLGFSNAVSQIQFNAEGNWNTSSSPSNISFRTTPVNVAISNFSPSVERVVITGDGTLYVSHSIIASAITTSLYGTASVANTASYAAVALSSSWAQTSSFSIFQVTQITQSISNQAQFSTQSLFATQSIFATKSIFATQSLFSTQSISASYAPVDPVYSGSISTQIGTKQDTLLVGGTYPITSSYANNSINSQTASTAIFAVTSSYLIYPSSTTTILSGSTISLVSISNTIYNSIFVAYILNDLQNFRAGNIVVLYNTQSAVLTEASTTDLGDSSGLIFSASLSASNVNLLAINGSSRDYSVKYHFDVL